MFRTSTSRTARAGRLSGVAIISVGLMLAGANAASAMTHDEAVAACQGHSTEAPPGQPTSFQLCVQINDTEWQASHDGYDGSPSNPLPKVSQAPTAKPAPKAAAKPKASKAPGKKKPTKASTKKAGKR